MSKTPISSEVTDVVECAIRSDSRAFWKSFDVAREKVVAGWLRIAFFLSILFNHTVKVQYEFVDERMWLVWAQMFRDFGAVGFFLLAGVSMRGKLLARGQFKLPSNLLKLSIAATVLAAFDMVYVLAKGGDVGPLRQHFYNALYQTNLWFFVAYALAGPLLLSLDRRGVLLTGICCLGFIMFPAQLPLESPYILQTISLAFVCMAIGMELHGRQANTVGMGSIAMIAFVARVWLDDFGYPVYPAIDIVLRIVYGVAWFMLLKSAADRLCRRFVPPGWATYLFVPYVLQIPLVIVVTVVVTAIFTSSLTVRMPPIFFSFSESVAFLMSIFVISMLASFCVAWLLHRFRIRV